VTEKRKIIDSEVRVSGSTEEQPPSLVPMTTGAAPFRSLLDIYENKSGYWAEAKREIQHSAYRRLEALERVYRDLLKQAREIVEGTQRDLKLHDIPVQASKIRGQIYYLYQRVDRSPSLFFSILSPEDYLQADSKAKYLASYRLCEDSSWQREDCQNGEEPWLSDAFFGN